MQGVKKQIAEMESAARGIWSRGEINEKLKTLAQLEKQLAELQKQHERKRKRDADNEAPLMRRLSHELVREVCGVHMGVGVTVSVPTHATTQIMKLAFYDAVVALPSRALSRTCSCFMASIPSSKRTA